MTNKVNNSTNGIKKELREYFNTRASHKRFYKKFFLRAAIDALDPTTPEEEHDDAIAYFMRDNPGMLAYDEDYTKAYYVIRNALLVKDNDEQLKSILNLLKAENAEPTSISDLCKQDGIENN